MLLGEPSPSLAKMNRMNSTELTAHIQRLTTEAAHLNRKIENLKRHQPSPVEHIEQLTNQVKRLLVLEKMAADRLQQAKSSCAGLSISRSLHSPAVRTTPGESNQPPLIRICSSKSEPPQMAVQAKIARLQKVRNGWF